MKALTYIEHGKFALTDKPKPQIINARDAIVRVTLGSICTSGPPVYQLCRQAHRWVSESGLDKR